MGRTVIEMELPWRKPREVYDQVAAVLMRRGIIITGAAGTRIFAEKGDVIITGLRRYEIDIMESTSGTLLRFEGWIQPWYSSTSQLSLTDNFFCWGGLYRRSGYRELMDMIRELAVIFGIPMQNLRWA